MEEAYSTIASAIGSVSSKVSALRDAYKELQVRCPSTASSLPWGDIEAYVYAAEKSITERFRSLHSRPRCAQRTHTLDSAAAKRDMPAEQVTPRPEIKDSCVDTNPVEPHDSLNKHRSDLCTLQDEVDAALRRAPNPAKVVLDVVEGINPDDQRVLLTGNGCIYILETLHLLSSQIELEEKQRAKRLATEWKNMITSEKDGTKIMGFLQLVGAFKLKSEFAASDIVDITVLGAKRNPILALELCKRIGIDDEYPALIQKFIKEEMHIEAVRYICALGLTQKIPPVGILEAHIKKSKSIASKILGKNNSSRSKKQATHVQVNAIQDVMKAIDEHKLVCHLTHESLEKQIEELLRRRECGVGTEAPSEVAGKKQTEQGNKRPRLDLPIANVAAHCPLLPLPTPHPQLFPNPAFKG